MTHTDDCLIASYHHLYNSCINWKNWMANPYYPHPPTSAAWFIQGTGSNAVFIGWLASLLFDTFTSACTVILLPSDACGRRSTPHWYSAMHLLSFSSAHGAEQQILYTLDVHWLCFDRTSGLGYFTAVSLHSGISDQWFWMCVMLWIIQTKR